MTSQDECFLRRTVELARLSRQGGDAPFGSVLVAADGNVLAEDHNTVQSDGDITAHPELKLARWAARRLEPEAAAATTLYTSGEPCGMCVGAIERSGIGRVVFALSRAQLADIWVRPVGVVRYDGPLLPDEAAEAVRGYRG